MLIFNDRKRCIPESWGILAVLVKDYGVITREGNLLQAWAVGPEPRLWWMDGCTGASSVFTTPSLPCLVLLFWEGALAEDWGMGCWKKAFREDPDSLSTILCWKHNTSLSHRIKAERYLEGYEACPMLPALEPGQRWGHSTFLWGRDLNRVSCG